MDDLNMKYIKNALMAQPDNVLKTLFLLAEFLPKDYSVKIKMFGPAGPVECGGGALVIAHSVESDKNPAKAVSIEIDSEPLQAPAVEKVEYSSIYGEMKESEDQDDIYLSKCGRWVWEDENAIRHFDSREDAEQFKAEIELRRWHCQSAADFFENAKVATCLPDSQLAMIAASIYLQLEETDNEV